MSEPTGIPASSPTPGEVTIAAPLEVAPSKKLGIGGKLAVGWLGAVAIIGLTVPWLPLRDPTTPNVQAQLAGPLEVSGFFFGGSSSGYDMGSLLAWGIRNSLMVAIGAVVLGTLVGGFFGLVAGYFGGKVDTLINGAFSVLLAIPALVLALALVAVLASTYVDTAGNNVVPSFARRVVVLIVALAVVSVPLLGRITRANTLVWVQRDFVTAAKAQGAKHRRIMFREVLPNVLPAMFSIALLAVAVVIVAEGGLSILSIGIPVEKPSLGSIIAGGRTPLSLDGKPHIVFEPVVVIFLTVMSLNYLGDVLRARFDVRDGAL